MTPRLSAVASCVVFYGLLTSSLAVIDVSYMDARILREHTLLDITRAIAQEYPAEISEALMGLTRVAHGDESVGMDIFNQLLSYDTFADEQRCSACTVSATIVIQSPVETI